MKCRAALAPPALQALALGQVEAQELELARVNDETSKGTYDYLLRAGFQASKPTSTFSAGTAEANARPSLIAHVRDISRYLVSNGLLLLQHAPRALDKVLSSFHGEAKTVMRDLVETAETTCKGHFMDAACKWHTADEDEADAGSLFSLARNGKPISCYRCGKHHFLREY